MHRNGKPEKYAESKQIVAYFACDYKISILAVGI